MREKNNGGKPRTKKQDLEREAKIGTIHAKLADGQSRKGAGVARCGVSQMRDPR